MTSIRWEPLPDGMVFQHWERCYDEGFFSHTESIEFLEVRYGGNAIACGSMPIEDEQEASLSNDIRLCRAVPDTSAPSDEVVEAIRICASYGMPLGITYAEYNKARDIVNEWLAQQRGQENKIS